MNAVLYELIGAGVVLLVILLFVANSLHYIGPNEVGLVIKRFGRRLHEGDMIAMNGEAGYQADLLRTGWRLKLWPLYAVEKHPWVQVPADGIGVVIAQVGGPLPIGAKSARYSEEFGDFSQLRTFLANGGQKGVQRPVLPPGTVTPIHPVAFLIITYSQVYGLPVSSDLPVNRNGLLTVESFDLAPDELRVTRIAPQGDRDVIGIVTALEGEPLSKGDIASRLGGYADIDQLENAGSPMAEVIGRLLGNKNDLHDNYQNFQAFLDHGGRIGLQHDPLLYGSYLINPFLVRVELHPMLVVNQGEVAVIKSYVGLPTEDTSGETFKFGSIVNPGHQGVWSEVLRTGKYAINPRCYAAEIVQTSILTLNWSTATSTAHQLDAALSPIDAKSREGFVFRIDLQVQIHVPDTMAPKVISMVGTMQNLVNEVLQSAVGNYFRNSLQGLPAVRFIETRDAVQEAAEQYVISYLQRYHVETRGVYIQDVILPQQLVDVLTAREIANQQKATYLQEREAETERIQLEAARGTAAAQVELSKSAVAIQVAKNASEAKKADAEGQAAFVRTTGEAEAAVTRAKGLAEAEVVKAQGVARAEGYEAQRQAIGEDATALVAALGEISEGRVKIVPDIVVGGQGGGLLDAALGRWMHQGNGKPAAPAADGARPAETQPAETQPAA